ncbi:MAG: hypothetical protein D6731_23650 [Planctomycetota bacterium]|nr:MAG: hypothetical protein D6731_23650 [Planctomycetota bacterium]
MRRVLLASAVPVLLALVAPTPASAQEEEQGVFARVEALRQGRFLVLESGARYSISNDAWLRLGPALRKLSPGDSLVFVHRNGALVSLGPRRPSGRPDSSRALKRAGRFVRQRPDGRRVWLVLDSGEELVISPRLLRNPDQARLLNTLDRDQSIYFWVQRGQVVRIAKSTATNEVDDDVRKVLARSRRGDLVHVQLKRESVPRFYRIVRIFAHRLVLSPQVPDTDPPRFSGQVEVELKEVAVVVNPSARDPSRNPRSGDSEGTEPGAEEGTDAWEGVAVGDTIGIGFKRGQLLELTPTRYRWRVWSRGFWGEELSGDRKSVQRVRTDIELDSRETVPLEGGKLDVWVSRSRSARKGGLRFRVELTHGVKPIILVGLKVRFLLGGLTMGPSDPVQASETETVRVPMFANKREVIVHEVADERLMDGRVEVAVYPKNIVPIASKDARKHILQVIARLKEPSQLATVYEAAGTNGDRQLCKFLLSRYLLEKDAEQRRALLRGLKAFGDTTPRVILDELRGLDRHLKIVSLLGDRLVDKPLPPGVRVVVYKRRMIEVLPLLDGGLKGEFGQQLFEVYQQRGEFHGVIESAFKARPRDAVTSLLGIATKVDRTGGNNELRVRADAAAKLLRTLGKPILPALYTELKRQEIDPSPCQDVFEKTGQASDAIRLGQRLLVERYLKLQEEEWEREVARAEGIAATDKKWDEALRIVRAVLAQKRDHERARALLPQLLVSKGMAHRAAGERGPAAMAFEEALPLLAPGERPKAAQPLAELLLQGASEDVEQVTLRALPHEAAKAVRAARLDESFKSREGPHGWVAVEVAEGKVAYVRRECTRPKGQGQVAIAEEHTPFKVVVDVLERVKQLSPALEAQANEIFGILSAREGKTKYEQANYQEALAHFEDAAKYAPTDPRLSLRFKCWLKANTTILVAVSLVVVFALGVVLMQMFSRPKKVAFKGEFKHYGADRTARERDLDVPGEE